MSTSSHIYVGELVGDDINEVLRALYLLSNKHQKKELIELPLGNTKKYNPFERIADRFLFYQLGHCAEYRRFIEFLDPKATLAELQGKGGKGSLFSSATFVLHPTVVDDVDYDADDEDSSSADGTDDGWQQCPWCKAPNEEGFTFPEPRLPDPKDIVTTHRPCPPQMKTPHHLRRARRCRRSGYGDKHDHRK
ncbi:hypothetical protein RUND412_011618, partial [Rhizina undulata]